MTVLATIGPTGLYLLFIWLLSAAIGAWVADRKGYGEKVGLTFGLLLSAIGLLIVLILPGRPGSRWKVDGPIPKRSERHPGLAAEAREEETPGPAGLSTRQAPLTAASACATSGHHHDRLTGDLVPREPHHLQPDAAQHGVLAVVVVERAPRRVKPEPVDLDDQPAGPEEIDLVAVDPRIDHGLGQVGAADQRQEHAPRPPIG